MKQFTTQVYYPENPVGFEYELQAVQNNIARLVWMEKIYPVAKVQSRYVRKEDSNTPLNPTLGTSGLGKYNDYFPQGRANGSDVDLSFNSADASRCFFLIGDKINVSPKTDTWRWEDNNVEITQHFSLIFSCNLNKLEIDSSEIVKTGILYELNKCRKLSVTLMYENAEDVWKEFTKTREIGSITRFPNYCLRLECALTYMAFPFNGNSQYNPANDDTNYTPQISFMDEVAQFLAQSRQILTIGDVAANKTYHSYFLGVITEIVTETNSYIANQDFTQESDLNGNPTGYITGVNLEFYTGQTIIAKR